MYLFFIKVQAKATNTQECSDKHILLSGSNMFIWQQNTNISKTHIQHHYFRISWVAQSYKQLGSIKLKSTNKYLGFTK